MVAATRITKKTMSKARQMVYETQQALPHTLACVRLRRRPCVPAAGPSTLMLMVPKARHHVCGCLLQQLSHGLKQAGAARQAGICSQSSHQWKQAVCLRLRYRWCKSRLMCTSAAHSRIQQRRLGVAGHGWTALTRAIWLVVMAWAVACGQAARQSTFAARHRLLVTVDDVIVALDLMADHLQ